MASAGRVLRGADWALPLRQALAQSPADSVNWMAQHTQLLKTDTYSRVGLLQLQQQTCCLKLYLAKSPLQRLGFRLGYGRPLRSFDAALQLSRYGLPAPTPRVCLSVPEGMMLLTEGIPDSRDLRALWLAEPTSEQAMQCMRYAGKVLAELHRAGFAHGDCKWSNLLWNGEHFYLVDLEAVRAVVPPAVGSATVHQRQVRDLARFTIDAEVLGASQQQYDTFLDTYCAAAHCAREPLVTALALAAATVRRRHAVRYGRAGEPLA